MTAYQEIVTRRITKVSQDDFVEGLREFRWNKKAAITLFEFINTVDYLCCTNDMMPVLSEKQIEKRKVVFRGYESLSNMFLCFETLEQLIKCAWPGFAGYTISQLAANGITTFKSKQTGFYITANKQYVYAKMFYTLSERDEPLE